MPKERYDVCRYFDSHFETYMGKDLSYDEAVKLQKECYEPQGPICYVSFEIRESIEGVNNETEK